jgi:hypothetical protein
MFVCVFVLFTQSCSQDEADITNIDYSEYLSLSKPNFDFALDWDNLSDTDKNTFRLAKKRMDIAFEKNGTCKTKWTSSSQINISDDLFNCFIEMIALSNKAIDIVYPSHWTFPRLKNGSERWDCCVVQSLVYVLQNFGASSGPYGLSSIDNWINTNNYYTYSSQYGMWGANIPEVLTHYLEGSYINKNAISSVNFSGSSQYIIILTGPPAHMVVATGRDSSGNINYYDAQNSTSGQCNVNDISDVYKSTYYNHY